MNLIRTTSRATTVCLAILILGASVFTGCDSEAPKEAHDALDAALANLGTSNYAGFIGAVVPEQRAGVESLEQWPYFQSVMSHEVNKGYDLDVTDDGCKIMSTLYFSDDREVFASLYFVMKNSGGWFIDLDATISAEIAKNGVQAFQGWTIETK